MDAACTQPIVDQPDHDPPPGFWRRQWHLCGTPWQRRFDLWFGCLLPALCVVLDPIVFREVYGFVLLSQWAMASYLLMAAACASLVAELLRPRRSLVLAGLFAGGALFAVVLGAYMLPLSLVGLMMVIGVLGFAPFVAAAVYLRNSFRIVRRYVLGASRAGRWEWSRFLLGLLLAATPFAASQEAQSRIDGAVTRLGSAEVAVRSDARGQIRRWVWLRGTDRLVEAYADHRGSDTGTELAELYRDLTGEPIEPRLWRLID